MRFVAVIVIMLFVIGMSACKSNSGSNVQSTSLERNKDGGGGGY